MSPRLTIAPPGDDMISLSKRFLYVHQPKTAGNAIQTVLQEYAVDTLYANPQQDGIQRFALKNSYGTTKHSPLREYLSALGPELFWSLTRFTTIRNPWERAISFYFSPHRGVTEWDRSSFIRVLDELQPMSWYIRLANDQDVPSGLKPIDIFLRHETLAADFHRLCRRLDIEAVPIPLRNMGNHRRFTEYYDARLIAEVAERYVNNISEFGYHFP